MNLFLASHSPFAPNFDGVQMSESIGYLGIFGLR